MVASGGVRRSDGWFFIAEETESCPWAEGIEPPGEGTGTEYSAELGLEGEGTDGIEATSRRLD